MFWFERLDETLIGCAIREHLDAEAGASFFISRVKVFTVFT